MKILTIGLFIIIFVIANMSNSLALPKNELGYRYKADDSFAIDVYTPIAVRTTLDEFARSLVKVDEKESKRPNVLLTSKKHQPVENGFLTFKFEKKSEEFVFSFKFKI